MNSYEERFSVHRTQSKNRPKTQSTTKGQARTEVEIKTLRKADPHTN